MVGALMEWVGLWRIEFVPLFAANIRATGNAVPEVIFCEICDASDALLFRPIACASQ
jgi:hypothetical protein